MKPDTVIPIEHARHLRVMYSMQDALTQTVMEVFASHPIDVLELAIGAGRRALERGNTFMEAMLVAENMIEICRVNDADRIELMAWRNRERLTSYQIKLTAVRR